ncbi:MMPL family transporter [Weissella bombi]|uniref:MMPL family protein n=1 Tax=Weissella bombi TaxID=1505725 RepID=A0A1C3ZHD2_9LACO|nr:MMPL family transporter [Weissella bombi]SCB81819.1 MMPL family protein [Weissella bombi]
MNNFLARFGKWTYNNKFKVLLSWVVILIVFIGSLVAMGSHFNTNLKISGVPSTDVQSVLKKEFNQSVDAGTMNIVVQNKQDDSIQEQADKKRINAAVKKIKADHQDNIKTITSPYDSQTISEDKTTGIISITFKKEANNVSKSVVNDIQKITNDKVKSNNLKVAYSGNVMMDYDIGGTSEIIGILIAFVLLMVLFKSFVTAGLPIITAIVGLVSGLIVVMLGTNVFSIASVAQTLSIMISLAVGIDYALFILHRFIGELKTSRQNELHKTGKVISEDEAMAVTLSSAGSSVLFAGVTVIIALVGLSLVGIDFLTQMGIAAAVGVVFAVLSAVTLLPALISLLHKFVKPSDKAVKSTKTKKDGFMTKSIVNHPIIMVIVSVIVLGAFMIPVSHMRLGMPFDGALPKNTTQRQAYEMTADKFGDGYNATLVGVVKLDTSNSDAQNKKILTKATDHIAKMDNVKMLAPVVNKEAVAKYKSPAMQEKIKADGQKYVQAKVMDLMKSNPTAGQAEQQQAIQKATQEYQAKITQEVKKAAISDVPAQISKDKKYALIIVMPKTNTASAKTETLAQKINSYSDSLQKSDDTKITLTGTNAVNIDISEKLNNAIPMFTGIVMVLAFVLLMFMFKSFIIPLMAIIGFGLSLFASLGLTTMIMQDGLFNISEKAPILAFLPVIVIGIIFGLAMDYEVFMVSRIRETYITTGDNKLAVKAGLQESGPVIITAALIMIAVFGSFALVQDPTIKAIGISLASGILFDAFFVRLIIIPATIKIFGRANWYFPGANYYNKFKD